MRAGLLGATTIILGLLLGLMVSEIGLRSVGWPSPGLYAGRSGPLALRAPGHEGGAYPPDTAGRLRHYDYDVEWLVNADGFRERALKPKQPGEWRIGILGDSFAAGVGVERHLRFADVWNHRTRWPNTTLWNLAAPLCGTACEAAILEGVGKKHDLDEIVLAFYGGNDVTDNLQWYRSGEGNRSSSSWSPSSDSTRRWLREHSRVATFAWINGFRLLGSFTPPGIYSPSIFQASWPWTDQALARLKEIVGVRPFRVWYIPATPEWSNKVWSAVREKYSFSDDSRFLVKTALQRWAEHNAVEFIDTSIWLRKCADVTACTFPIDGHWNVEAHKRVGEGLAEAIKRVDRVQDAPERGSGHVAHTTKTVR